MFFLSFYLSVLNLNPRGIADKYKYSIFFKGGGVRQKENKHRIKEDVSKDILNVGVPRDEGVFGSVPDSLESFVNISKKWLSDSGDGCPCVFGSVPDSHGKLQFAPAINEYRFYDVTTTTNYIEKDFNCESNWRSFLETFKLSKGIAKRIREVRRTEELSGHVKQTHRCIISKNFRSSRVRVFNSVLDSPPELAAFIFKSDSPSNMKCYGILIEIVNRLRQFLMPGEMSNQREIKFCNSGCAKFSVSHGRVFNSVLDSPPCALDRLLNLTHRQIQRCTNF